MRDEFQEPGEGGTSTMRRSGGDSGRKTMSVLKLSINDTRRGWKKVIELCN